MVMREPDWDGCCDVASVKRMDIPVRGINPGGQLIKYRRNTEKLRRHAVPYQHASQDSLDYEHVFSSSQSHSECER